MDNLIKSPPRADSSDSSNSSELDNTLDNFFKRYINSIYSDTGQLPKTLLEPQWPSVCQQGEAFIDTTKQQSIYWQPVQRTENTGLCGLETALDITLHPSIHSFYCRYWSEQIDTIFQQGNLTLLFIWNEKDMQRLIENQLGHALNKQRNKQTLTFFIACTDSDYMISIDNNSGHIVLERPG